MSSQPTSPYFTRLAMGVRWVVYLILCITPFLFTWVNEELFEFPKMLLVYGLTGIGLTLAIMDHAWRNDWRWPQTKFDWLIGAFVASQVLATLFSIHPRTSWLGYYTRFNGGLLSTLTFVALYYLIVRYFSAQQLVRLSQTLIVIGVLTAAYALPEHFGHSPSCALIAKSFSVSCWVQDVQTRVFGTFGQPNWLAAYLITIMPLTLTWLGQTRSRLYQVLFGASWLIMLAVVLFTKSRSGLLGLGVGLGVWICLQTWHVFKTNTSIAIFRLKNPGLAWLVGIALLTCGLISWTGSPFTPSMTQWWQTNTVSPTPVTKPAGTALETGGTESGAIRQIVWSGAVAVWQRYPWFGSGVETFAYSYYQDRPAAHNLISEWDFLYNKAHNELLNYLATTGLVGLGTYLALWVGIGVWVILWLSRRSTSDVDAQHQGLAIAWIAGLSGQFVSNFFGFSTVMVNVLFWVGLACLAQWLARSKSTPLEPAHLPKTFTFPTWFNNTLVAAACLASVFIVIQVNRWWTADRDFALSKALFQAGQYQSAMTKLEAAINQSPDEALFWDELASQYSLLATGLKAETKSSDSGQLAVQLAEAAVTASDRTLSLNSRHLDFYKTRSRVFINLSQVNPAYLEKAQETLESARLLAPTDPKLVYHLGLVKIAAHHTEAGLDDLELAVTMKPDYLTAWFDLGKAYEQASHSAKAQDTYQHILTTLSPGNPEVTARLKALTFSKNLP